jgi:peptide/nickel transport system substrate-binding protein
MSYPYISATDGLALYFDGRSRPTPNRMNWNDSETDRLIDVAKSDLDPAKRAEAIAQVQRIVAQNNVWLPIARENLYLAASTRVEGARAHGIYGAGLYKGLDLRLTR